MINEYTNSKVIKKTQEIKYKVNEVVGHTKSISILIGTADGPEKRKNCFLGPFFSSKKMHFLALVECCNMHDRLR